MVGGRPDQGGTVGYEMFNQSGLGALGMTEFSQRLNLQRALEGELSRTIGRLGNVEIAQVRLVLPAPTLLTEREKPATAAVVSSCGRWPGADQGAHARPGQRDPDAA